MRDYDWAGWSRWISLVKLMEDGFSRVGDEAGVYAISTAESKIPRVAGIDRYGLLYVGAAGHLRSKIKAFHDCVERGHQTDAAGWRYNLLELARCAPIKSLRVRWCDAKARDDMFETQIRLLYDYVINHCELPPLNSSLERNLTRELTIRSKRNGE
jgi:hypothetical protein